MQGQQSCRQCGATGRLCRTVGADSAAPEVPQLFSTSQLNPSAETLGSLLALLLKLDSRLSEEW